MYIALVSSNTEKCSFISFLWLRGVMQHDFWKIVRSGLPPPHPPPLPFYQGEEIVLSQGKQNTENNSIRKAMWFFVCIFHK